ncbi:MAG: gamma-glutamylcyclotransferase [Pseudomonadota bacterium]
MTLSTDLPGVEAEWSALDLPPGQDFWVFGYGSLMWNPGFAHQEACQAKLHGYHRRFCVFSHNHRGTPDKPGLVFGLDRGGACRGMAYRISHDQGPAVMAYLYEREMVYGVYMPRWVPVDLGNRRVRAATFVVNRRDPLYAGRIGEREMLRLVRQGVGTSGTCGDYLRNTLTHLEAIGLTDAKLSRLYEML